MKCPVCKTECYSDGICPECGFAEINRVFTSQNEGEYWLEHTVWPWRYKYWETLSNFEIDGRTLVKCKNRPRDGVLIVPYGIQRIGPRAFSNFQNPRMKIIRAMFPSTLQEIGDGAFVLCNSLQHVLLPKGLKSIGCRAFEGCTNLNEVIIPNSCTTIKLFAFANCENLRSVYCEQKSAPKGWDKRWIDREQTTIYWADEWHYENGIPEVNNEFEIVDIDDSIFINPIPADNSDTEIW